MESIYQAMKETVTIGWDALVDFAETHPAISGAFLASLLVVPWVLARL
jgi:hypothetical protein